VRIAHAADIQHSNAINGSIYRPVRMACDDEIRRYLPNVFGELRIRQHRVQSRAVFLTWSNVHA